MFAIIDIETTGGSPDRNRITEIAIILHDGEQIIKEYSTLINPKCNIPYYITQVTGINDDMVKDAPYFHEVAKEILELTEHATFVAHNVKFDYSFVKAAYKDLGYEYHRKTLCTVQLSRSTFPGLPSYSLGNLCESLQIPVENRHRALGDAKATAILFNKILAINNKNDEKWVAPNTKINTPPLLDEKIFAQIPSGITGVYYFLNAAGDIIYVGKSNDIKKRIQQHFASQTSTKAIRMHHEIADIRYENMATELIALLYESDEIKKVKPTHNRAQKKLRSIPLYSINQRLDEKGYIQLYFERLTEQSEPLMTVDSMRGAKAIFYKLVEEFNLCLAKCSLHNTGGACFNYHIKTCNGACMNLEESVEYNKRANEAINSFCFQNKSFFILDKGRTENEKSIVCIEKGQYKGFGFIENKNDISTDDMKSAIKKMNHNRDIQTILTRFIEQSELIYY
jgi:DNA polymerase-3 subunit epsilon